MTYSSKESSKDFTDRGGEIVTWLEREFTGIRTGRATPALLDLVQVESYGTRVPIMQVGSVSVEDPRTLRISVWDQNVIKAVEKGILEANLGISVTVDGSGLRIFFPELTSERRAQLLKLAKTKLEEARVSIRGARDEVLKQVETAEKTGGLSQDERFTFKEELQKKVDIFNASLSTLLDLKEKEINN